MRFCKGGKFSLLAFIQNLILEKMKGAQVFPKKKAENGKLKLTFAIHAEHLIHRQTQTKFCDHNLILESFLSSFDLYFICSFIKL